MRKIIVLFVLCASIFTAKAQLDVKEVNLKDASPAVKQYITMAGSRYVKDSLVVIPDAAEIVQIYLIKGIQSRQKDSLGVRLVEDQYLVVYKDAAGKENAFLSLNDPTDGGTIAKSEDLVKVMKDSGLHQGDDEFQVKEEFNF